MPNITNKSQSPLRLPRGARIAAGATAAVPAADWEKQKNHVVVKAWLASGFLVVGSKGKAVVENDADGEGNGAPVVVNDDSNGDEDAGDDEDDSSEDGDDVTEAEERYRAMTNAELAKAINAKKANAAKIGMTKDQLVEVAIEIEA